MLGKTFQRSFAFAISLMAHNAWADDVRAYQHGIDIVETSPGEFVAIWASSGLHPTGEDADGEWVHDVFQAQFSVNNPVLDPKILITAPLAQEPASAAATLNGNILVTLEDAWQAENVLMQSFAVFDKQMRSVLPYQSIVLDGGHSGHVAATDTQFVVFYSEGWVDGGGVDNLGSGDDVWLKTYTSQGRLQAEQQVAVGNATRDWWPLAAGSHDRVLLLWQRFIEGRRDAQLIARLYNPDRNQWITNEFSILGDVAYYTYDVQFLAALDAFLIVGTTSSRRGFAVLLSNTGQALSIRSGLPAFVREGQPAIRNLANGLVQVVYPTGRNRLSVFEVTENSITHSRDLKVPENWTTAGIDGIFDANGGLFFIALSQQGARSIEIPAWQ